MTGGKMVCPWWFCFTFDNPLRKLLHNPEAMLSPYVRPGSTVIDIGPGMGYFSIPLARLVGPTGHVIAIDVQAKMLAALTSRARRSGVSERIQPHLASSDSLGNHPKADFVMAFWMVHEVPNQRAFLTEIFGVSKARGAFPSRGTHLTRAEEQLFTDNTDRERSRLHRERYAENTPKS